ncbi:nuclear mitotic apparatus protein 1 isoform X1 [Anolis carolinensis]|uniref:nuclear mitotic apparatus protein 1 isoform X1 n=1 Tax=Anolis carolinensis TaxID=28377 RepID=UPI002F2B6B6E
MQTPQFQLRRLKNLLEAERENRDELEHELAENRKLIDEKDTRILMMKQRIDRLTLLHERQAADQMEPKEMEELREKNESLLMRLHETLKQCQDLKTEKGQMDRKINQLSEENGDLSFRLREFSRTLTELRGAMNEISEEHDKALREWEERRSRLETELHGALSEKRSLEEKVEILQGKYSLLEDQFTKLKDSMSLPEKGEVMSDVLKLADLNQQVSDLSGKQAELQARILGLEEEKHLLEVNLQSERRSFDSEKAQLTSLLTDLQKSASEISRAKDQLEQDRQAQEVRLVAQVRTLTEEIAKLTGCLHQKDGELLALHQQVEMERIQKGQLVEDLQKNEQVSQAALQELNLQVDHLNNTLKQSGEKLAQVEAASQEEYNKAAQEKELALRQLQQKEAELVTLGKRLQSLEQARSTSVAEAQREKAELNQKIQELEARALALTAQCQQSEAQAVALPALKSQLREAQQRLAEKEKLSKENTRLQERLLILEESVRNTEGILEDEKRRAGESLESNLRRIAELEEQIQELVKDRDQAAQKVDAEKAQRQALEGQVREMGEESRSKVQELQQQVAELSSVTKGQSGEEMVRGLVRDREQLQQKLKAEHEKVAEAEAQMKRLRTKHQDALAELQASLSLAHSQAKVREGAEEKLRSEVASLQEEIAASRQEAAQSLAKAQKDGHEATRALEAATRDMAEAKLKVAELETKVKQLSEQSQKDLTTAESSLSSLKSSLKEKEQEVGQFSTQVKSLKAKLEEATQQQKRDLALQEEERKRLAGEEERAKAELATEKAAKAALEVQLQNLTNEHRVEVSGLQEEVTRAQDLAAEKERELEELRLKNVSRSEELRDLQKTVSKLKGELASVEALKEREAKMERELQGFLEVARTRETEMESIKATLHSKDLSLKHLEEEKRLREQECSSSRELCEKQLKECEGLRAQVGKLERQNKEQQSTIAKLEKAAATLEQGQETATEALKQEVAQYKQRASELEKLLQAAKSVQEANLEKLRRELLGKGEELAQSREAASKAEKELASLRASAQEKGKSEESWKEQMSRCLQDAERKASLISSLEQEMSIMHRQLLEKEAESKDLRRLVLAESEKSKKLEERLRLLQSEMATAASRAAERCSAMKVEAQNYQEQAEKLHVSVEALKKELGALSKREEDLCKELKAWQEKAFQKEQLLSTRQQELVSAQALIGELMPVKRLYQQLQMEQASQESKHRQEAEQMQKAAGGLQAELAQTKRELAELLATKDRFLEQERAIQRLQAENSGYTEQLATLQRAHSQLAEENRALSERSSHGLQRLDTELAQAKQKYTQELEAAKLDSEKMMAATKREAEEAQKKLETMTNKYEEAKQKLLTQVERLEVYKKEQAKQVDELKQKLSQQEKAGQTHLQKAQKREEELQAMVRQANEKAGELQAQLTQKEKATEHYKAQMEKAKTHYNAKKQENQELAKKLKGLEQLEKENMELKAESERLVKELQHTVMQAKESELSCKNLTGRVRSLEAQVEFADRQLREQGKFQVAKDTLKSRETFRQSAADISTDSLDLSASEETQPLNFTSRRTRRSLSESGPAERSKASQTQLPRKMESLESLYFTPIPTRSRSKLENSMASATEASFESGHKTLSGRRRTTQVISITMTKKRPEAEGPISPNESFFSIHSESSQASSQETLKTRLRSAATSSTRSLPSLASPESLNRLSSSSPNDTATSNAALMSLPGYRPTTRSSSLRHPQPTAGGTGTGRRRSSSFYVGSCHDEPEPLDEWNRIAELQERNRVCPPHLKTCYPLESRPSQSLTTITDEEILTGDPKETLRRATLLPSQVAEVRSTRRSTLSTAGTEGGIATRQQRKRLSDEPQHGLGTPESKKSASCFPRPQTPKGRTEDHKHSSQAGSKKSKGQAADKQPERRQSLAFTLLNTPKKLGNSLLRRGANRKVTPKNSPRGGIRRSPRTSASPRGKANNTKLLRNTKF